MLDMGFLPDIRRILRHLPARRQTLFFCATMPPPIAGADARDAAQPGHDQPGAPGRARRRDHAGGLPGAAGAEVGAVPGPAPAGRHAGGARLHPHQAPRQPARRSSWCGTASRPSGSTGTGRRRSAPQALAGFKSGKYRVLVATDIAARGIDIEALGHVVNFDVPKVPEDYIHRVGRTARAEAVGDAFTFVAPEEEPDLRRIERAIGRRLPRVAAAGLRLYGEAGGDAWRCRSASGSPRSRRRGRGEVKPGVHRAHRRTATPWTSADRHFLRVPSHSPRASCPPRDSWVIPP